MGRFWCFDSKRQPDDNSDNRKDSANKTSKGILKKNGESVGNDKKGKVRFCEEESAKSKKGLIITEIEDTRDKEEIVEDRIEYLEMLIENIKRNYKKSNEKSFSIEDMEGKKITICRKMISGLCEGLKGIIEEFQRHN